MSKLAKVVSGLAIVGFALPLVMLTYYSLSGRMAGSELLWICPASVLSMALDNAPLALSIVAWLLICTSNAILYTLPALPFVFVRAFLQRH